MTMDNGVVVVLAPVAGQVVNCLTHLTLCQIAGRRPYVAIFAGFFVGLLVTAAVSAAAVLERDVRMADMVGRCGLNLLTYGALGWGYFHFVNLNIASLRIRMLLEIGDSGGATNEDELRARYNVNEMIALRIERLLDGGHLVERNARFYSGRREFLLIGRVFEALRRFILGRPTQPPPSSNVD